LPQPKSAKIDPATGKAARRSTRGKALQGVGS